MKTSVGMFDFPCCTVHRGPRSALNCYQGCKSNCTWYGIYTVRHRWLCQDRTLVWHFLAQSSSYSQQSLSVLCELWGRGGDLQTHILWSYLDIGNWNWSNCASEDWGGIFYNMVVIATSCKDRIIFGLLQGVKQTDPGTREELFSFPLDYT